MIARFRLLETEQEVLRARFHWIGYVRAWLWTGIGILSAFLWFLASMGMSDQVGGAAFWAVMSWIFMPVGLATLLVTWLSHERRVLVVTSQRVFGRKGILQERSINTMLTGVDAVDVDQTFLGQILNYGLVKIYWTGGGEHPRRFYDVADPQTVMETILRQREFAARPVA